MNAVHPSIPVGWPEVLFTVEPNVIKANLQGVVLGQKRQGTTDVIRVDVRHQEQVKVALCRRHFQNARLQVREAGGGAAVDQHT